VAAQAVKAKVRTKVRTKVTAVTAQAAVAANSGISPEVVVVVPEGTDLTRIQVQLKATPFLSVSPSVTHKFPKALKQRRDEAVRCPAHYMSYPSNTNDEWHVVLPPDLKG
jgi:cell division protein YceG involved in septum cleavage